MDAQKIDNIQQELIDGRKISFFSSGPIEIDSPLTRIKSNENQPDWVLDILLSCCDEDESSHFNITVHLSCFSHTSWGNHMIHKLTGNMQGEVCRTNRRWRRRVDRQSTPEISS